MRFAGVLQFQAAVILPFVLAEHVEQDLGVVTRCRGQRQRVYRGIGLETQDQRRDKPLPGDRILSLVLRIGSTSGHDETPSTAQVLVEYLLILLVELEAILIEPLDQVSASPALTTCTL